MTYGYVKKANDHDYKAEVTKTVKKLSGTMGRNPTQKDINWLKRNSPKITRKKSYGV